jgi:hypothetical protein
MRKPKHTLQGPKGLRAARPLRSLTGVAAPPVRTACSAGAVAKGAAPLVSSSCSCCASNLPQAGSVGHADEMATYFALAGEAR